MKLYFRELGAGQPLIVLHGLLGTSDNWYSLGRLWAEHYRVFLVDQRNHGRSPHHPQAGYDALAGDINELLLDHGIRDVIVLGHSMGGKVAMTLAQYYPHKIAKMIVVDIAPKRYDAPQFQELLEVLLSLDLARIRTRQEAEAQIAPRVPDPAVRRFLLKNLRRGSDQPFTWKANLPVLRRHIEEIAGEIPVLGTYSNPTLFVRGETSRYVLDEDMAYIQQLFPNAELTTIPGAGHWVHAEAPEAFDKVVREFLDRG